MNNLQSRQAFRFVYFVLLILLLLFTSDSARAQLRTIQSSGNWSNTAIWTGGNRADVVGEDVVMNNNLAGSGIVTVNVNYTVGSVDVRDGNDLVIDNNRTLTIGDAGNADDLTIGDGSSVTVNTNGTLTIWDDLIINTNDIAVLNVQGTVTIRGDIILNQNATLTLNGSGSVSVVGDIRYNSTNADFINNGEITVGDDIIIVNDDNNGNTLSNTGTLNFPVVDLNDGNFTLTNSGTINQTGDFLDVDNGSSFTNQTNGTWNFSGTEIGGVRLFAASYPNTFNYNRAGNQTIISPQDAYSHLILSNSGTKSSGLLASFQVRGDWTRSGDAVFASILGRVSLTGSVTQTVSAVGGETFWNLTIDNSSAGSPQIILNDAVNIQGGLRMDDGNIDLNGNSITIGPGGFLTPALTHNDGWMYDGSLIRSMSENAVTFGSDAGLFPMGTASEYRPFFIGKDDVNNSEGTLTVSHTDPGTATDVDFSDNTIPVVSGSTVTIDQRHNAYWATSYTGFTGATLGIGAGGTGFIIGAVSDVRLTREGDATSIGVADASSGTPTNVLARRSGLSPTALNNNFHLASINQANSPLPVTLAYFRAKLQEGHVTASWKTTQERNNHFFTVQKTTDFETFYEAGVVFGKGNSMDENNYTFVDHSPVPGKSYYRLKQTDFDGTFSFSAPVMIDYSGPMATFLKVYPNPSDGHTITLEIKGVTGLHVVDVHLYNQQGEKVLEIPIPEAAPGEFKKEVVFKDRLRPGMYIAKAGKTLQLISKIVVY